MKLRAILLVVSFLCLGASCPGAAGAATASWRFEPPSFDFGVRLPAEGPTSAKSFELQNTGEVPLTPTFVSVSDQRGSGFELAGNSCSHTLAPGAGCIIGVTFDPRNEGRTEGTLTVETSNSAVAAATAQLLGSGGEPVVAIDPAAVTFATVPIPTASLAGRSAGTVTVTNVGSANLSIDGLGFEEEGLPPGTRPNFLVSGGAIGPGLCLHATVPPGGRCGIDLEFAPESPGTYNAEIALEDNAPGPQQAVLLHGIAVAQAATATPPAPTPAPPPVPQRASSPGFAHKPPLRTKSRTATFAFSAASSPGGFQCRSGIKQGFRPCTSPAHLRGLTPGPQVFSVRAVGAIGEPGPVRTYHWRIVR